LKEEKAINSAFLPDFDAHTGNGNIDTLPGRQKVKILNPFAENRNDYGRIVENCISSIEYVDIVAASAGFDSYEKDIGGKMSRFNFRNIVRILKRFSKKLRHRRRFAALESGYYLPDLSKDTLAFCQGFE